uniref:SEC16-like protein A, endoplasmic reticulum export factor n=2 Tax=Molossus molossus TaxID=27622 RepID=A0A7J8EGH0_MOLMO|nr:SEC16-like protein A, endoplasmic reticulum export factor [Molossus molossus]
MFSRKAAGTRARYVDVLNPGGPQRADLAPAPADLFAPLAPLPIPTHLFGPNPDAEGAPPAEASSREGRWPAGGPAHPEPSSEPQAPSDCPPAGDPPQAAVAFYNPTQFTQASVTSASSRSGRVGQRKYPVLR